MSYFIRRTTVLTPWSPSEVGASRDYKPTGGGRRRRVYLKLIIKRNSNGSPLKGVTLVRVGFVRFGLKME